MTDAALSARHDTMVEDTGSIIKWFSAISFCIDIAIVAMMRSKQGRTDQVCR